MLSSNAFYDKFYENFLRSHPGVSERFTGVDMANQKKLLRHGLNLLIMHADSNIAGRLGLDRIKTTHSPGYLNIPHYMYGYWHASFIKTLKEMDPDIDPEVLKHWDGVIKQGIAYIAPNQNGKAAYAS